MTRFERIAWGIAFIATMVVGLATARAFLPAGWWFSPERLTIVDLVEGDPVVMEFERQIRRPFQAEWVVTLRRATDKGLEQVCEARGTSRYLPSAVLPRPLTLFWYMGKEPVACPMPPGQYQVDAAWLIDDGVWGKKQAEVTSRLFRVSPRPRSI